MTILADPTTSVTYVEFSYPEEDGESTSVVETKAENHAEFERTEPLATAIWSSLELRALGAALEYQCWEPEPVMFRWVLGDRSVLAWQTFGFAPVKFDVPTEYMPGRFDTAAVAPEWAAVSSDSEPTSASMPGAAPSIQAFPKIMRRVLAGEIEQRTGRQRHRVSAPHLTEEQMIALGTPTVIPQRRRGQR